MLHKEVTFARAVDWIEEVFRLSQWVGRYKSAFSLFASLERREASLDIQRWAEEKCKKWGVKIHTVFTWLYTKQALSPVLLQEAKREAETPLSLFHYIEVATYIPEKYELKRAIIEKAKKEGLTVKARGSQSCSGSERRRREASHFGHSFMKKAEEVIRDVRVERMPEEPTAKKAREVIEKIELHAKLSQYKLTLVEVASF